MTLLRITSATSAAHDSLKARMSSLQRALAGVTTLGALERAETDLMAIASEAKALRVMVRQEMAQAKQQAREDRSIRKVG